MNRLFVQDKISELLAVFGRKISILSANNEHSWNSLAENIVIPIVNLALEGDFINENIESFTNSPAIDLVDRKSRITIQVTSGGNFIKIKRTLEKFFNNSLENDFDQVFIVILKEKKGFAITHNQEEQLSDIIQDRIEFNCKQNILDFGRIYTLLNRASIDDLTQLNNHLEKELGNLSAQLIKNSPAVTVFFDEGFAEHALKIVKGLLERDLRIRYFSAGLEELIEKSAIENQYCQRLFDISQESRATLILSTKEFVSKIEKGQLMEPELAMLKNPHLKHVLIKFDDESSLRKFDWISPIVQRGLTSNINAVLNYASNELHKVNKVIEIQDYTDFETIIKLFDSKAIFGIPKTSKDSKKKTGYKLLTATDNLRGVTTNYLFIPNGTSIKPTASLFYMENPELKSRRDTIILLLPKERTQIRLEDRLKNAEKAFKPKKAFYIDEFLNDYCTEGLIEKESEVKFSLTKNFIQPELKAIEGELSDFDQIENWILSEFDPMLVITGGGGIGKTTLAREIADMYYNINTNAKIVFIEASNPKVIQNLSRLSETGQIDLYDFYSSVDRISKISRDLFRVTIDNGNLMLIIDGLDEVFSRIPDFDIEYFINSVRNDFIKQIGVGKVLLTCRTYFWKEQISKESSINHFEIEPFSIDHALRFYSMKFDDDKKVSKAITLLKRMDLDMHDNQKYLPFVVDIVGEIIDSDGEIIDNEEDSDLIHLDLKNQIDFIVYRILNRERIRIGINVNVQIQFLIQLAVFYHGAINRMRINDMQEPNYGFVLDDSRIESLKSHPLINVQNNIIGFKYDFFELYFKVLYLSSFISIESKEPICKEVVDILLQEGKFGSSLFHEIAKRNENSWSEDNLLKIVDLIEESDKFQISSVKDILKVKHQLKSSFFALALTINQCKSDNNTITNTELLKTIFGNKNQIMGLSLVNFGILDGNIKFNFSNLEVKDSYFDSYDSFWECKYNDSTRFIDCTFYNMPNYSRSNSQGIQRYKFINARYDMSFEEYFKEEENSEGSTRSNVKSSLSNFLKLFYSNGMISDKDYLSSIKNNYRKKDRLKLPIEVIEKVLTNSTLLAIDYGKTRPEDVASIKIDFREDVDKLLYEGVETVRMKRILDSMTKIVKAKFNLRH